MGNYVPEDLAAKRAKMATLRESRLSSDEIGTYARSILEIAGRILPRSQGRRLESHHEHYLRVARRLDVRVGDLHLTLAALLHGWPVPSAPARTNPTNALLPVRPSSFLPLEVRRLLPINAADPVEAILRGRALFRRVAAGPGAAQRLELILGQLEHPGSVLLFIEEQLDHITPDDEFRQWVLSFRERPCRPTSARALPTPRRREYLEHVVAPTADFWGCRVERWMAEDLIAIARDSDRFDQVCEAVIDEVRTAPIAARVGSALADSPITMQVCDVKWCWRHAGHIARTLARYRQAEWGDHLLECGSVDVVCRGGEACYAVLRTLHESFPYRRDLVRDWIARASANGYRALHTSLKLPVDARGGARGPTMVVEVRLIPKAHLAQTTSRVDRDRWIGIQGRIEHDKQHRRITVFTPTRPQSCQRGTTTLDLAANLNATWVAMDLEIRVNGRVVADRMHLLHQDDIVEFMPRDGARIRPLPPDFRSRSVDPAGLERAWRTRARDLQSKWGRDHLVEQLRAFGVTEISDLVLSILFNDVQQSIRRSLVASADGDSPLAEHWLLDETEWFKRMGQQQLTQFAQLSGLAKMSDEGGRIPDIGVLHLLNALRRRIEWLHAFADHHHDPPGGSVLEVERARDCISDNQTSTLAIEVRASRDRRSWGLVVHSATCRSAANLSTRLQPTIRLLERRFILRVLSRPGLLADVGRCFQEERIDIQSINAHRRPHGLSFIALTAMVPEDGEIHQLVERLGRIDDVMEAYGPDRPLPPGMGLMFAARRRAVVRSDVEPWVTGPAVDRSEAFYGREEELGWLRRRFDDLARASGCRHVYLTGPLRAGKSSLLARFSHLVEHELRADSAVARVHYQKGMGWLELHEQLYSAVARALTEYANLDLDRLSEAPFDARLRELIKAFRYERPEIPLVIAIDEAIALIDETRADRRGLDSMARWLENLADLTRVLVIWIGPHMRDAGWWPRALLSGTQHWQWLELDRVDRGLVRDILEARNIDALNILASEAVVDRVWQWTQGDMALTVALARYLYDKSPTRHNDMVTYRVGEVALAVQRLVTKDPLFASRLCLGDGDPDEVAREQILTVISDQWRLRRGAFLKSRGAGLFRVPVADLCAPTGLTQGTIVDALGKSISSGGVEIVPHDDRLYLRVLPFVAEYLMTLSSRKNP